MATLLAPAAPQVPGRAAAAHDDPGAYLWEHADRLDNRGIDEPFPGLPWIALVDALADHGLPAPRADDLVALAGAAGFTAAVLGRQPAALFGSCRGCPRQSGG